MSAFSGIQGQPKAVKLLSRALSTGRLAHAYLFTGPEGVGKATTARAVAAFLFCEAERKTAPCGHCAGCLQFASDNHPDFLLIRPQGATIKIDQIRALKKALAFPPLEAERRVILVEDVHTMRRETGNSLLKMLEEPPPDNLLILIASASEPMLPTILSRCQVIPFFPLPVGLAADILLRLDPHLQRDEALDLAGLTDGCPGRARSLDTDGVPAMRNEILEALLAPAAGEAEAMENALALAARAAELKDGLPSLLDLLRIFFQEVMVASLTGSRPKGEACTAAGHIDRARERWNLTQLSDSIKSIDYAEKALGRNCNRALVCEVLFLNLFAADAG
ncbi:DNA polymerase III subunit tau [bacterium BMS3Bbin14]|nr:DNA polymerase III subunit tau [bacterium BMS3Abin13]GBE52875.1 DNA polymerase III subunit tau [bacterium BMS3Bbin14]